MCNKLYEGRAQREDTIFSPDLISHLPKKNTTAVIVDPFAINAALCTPD